MPRSGSPDSKGAFGLDPAAAVLAVAFVVAVAALFSTAPLADFRAGWLAGQAFAGGRPEAIYPPADAVFRLRPPAEWLGRLQEEGYRGPVYPFVYPPLWAWVAAQVSKLAGYDLIAAAAVALNGAMMVAMLLMARRLAAPGTGRALYLAVGLGFLLATRIGLIGLYEGQPQILVAFLTVLAIERAEGGHPRSAGAALALAASIKLFPALLALLFLARGQVRAAVSFALAGTALAALSVAVAGWPLHDRFLGVLAEIARTTIVTQLTYSFESLAAHLVQGEQLDRVARVALPPGTEGGRLAILAEPAWFQLAFALLQVAAVAAVALLFRRIGRDRPARFPPLLWPFALTALALTGPLAWAYYFLAPAAFLPALLGRLPRRRAVLWLVVPAALLSPFVPVGAAARLVPGLQGEFLVQTAGTLTLAALCLLFLRLALGAAPPRAASGRAG